MSFSERFKLFLSENNLQDYSKKQMTTCYTVFLRLEIIGKYFTELDRRVSVMDFGSSILIFSRYLARLGNNVTAIDVDVKEIKTENLNVICGDFKDIHLAGKFDHILCLDVFEHLSAPDQQELFDFLGKHLEEKGTLIFSMPNSLSINYGLKYILNKYILLKKEMDPHFLYPFWKIDSIVRKGGFDIRSRVGCDRFFRLIRQPSPIVLNLLYFFESFIGFLIPPIFSSNYILFLEKRKS